jgi:tetratricopeptide (TPR) repeat protein
MRLALPFVLGLVFLCSGCQHKEVKWLREGTKQGKSGAYDDALHSFEMAIQLNPNSAQAYQGKGYTLELMGRQDEAMQAFDKAIALEANYPQPWLSKGMLYLKMQKPADANMAFTRALQLNPDWDQAHFEKGLALAETERYADAIQEFSAAIGLSPSVAASYFGRAKSYLCKGDTLRFFADLKSAVKLDTTYFSKARSDSSLIGMHAFPEFVRIVER